jgi:hypothetical protein
MMVLPPKPEKTIADYLAMAVAPALIMGMVGSLMLFLVDVGYRGPFGAQVRWTLCWFVLASVLVSRIAIQQGSNYAALYGLVLGAATAFRLTQFLGLHPGALLLIAILWWCASKLTWDCTLIDDEKDASGEGLLHRAKLDPAGDDSHHASAGPVPSTATITAPGNASAHGTTARPPHVPGLWVLYFSLGALPLFGLGQLAIPADDGVIRLRTFLFLCVYLACALGLLFITSFLGLRRYLRQRRLVMPATTARLWMTFGAGATLAVLIAALFLPRPEAADTLAGLVGHTQPLRPPDSSHARWAGEQDEADERLSRRSAGHDPDRDEERGDAIQPDDDSRRRGTARAEQSDRVEADRQQEAAQGRGNGDRDAGRPPMPQELPSPPGDLIAWLRWITLAAGLLLVAVMLIRFGRQWLDALRRSRSRRKKPVMQPTAEAAPAPRPFAAYPDPFVTNRAARMTSAQLTAYTFEALQAWATERGWGRRPNQTPAEFGHALAGQVPDLSQELAGTMRLYQRLAYAPELAGPGSIDVLQRLWSGLNRS